MQKIRYGIWILALCTIWSIQPSASGAAATASFSGNWHDPHTWGDSFASAVVPNAYPGVGDNIVSIVNGVTVTCEPGQTCVVGTSPTDDTGTPAVQCATSSGTGILNWGAGSTFIWKGPIRQCNANWTAAAGVTFTYSAPSATALYTWDISMGGTQANAILVLNGTSSSRITWQSDNPAYYSGTVGNGGTANVDGGRINATFVDFSRVGLSTGLGVAFNPRMTASTSTFSITDSTFDHCAQMFLNGLGGASSFIWRRNKFTNSMNAKSFNYGENAAKTTGTREMSSSYWEGQVYFLGTLGTSSDFVIHDLTFGTPSAADAVASAGILVWPTGHTANISNLLHANMGTADATVTMPGGGTLDGLYWYRQDNPANVNHHITTGNAKSANVVINRSVYEYTGGDFSGDLYQINGDATTAKTYQVKNFLAIMNGGGDNPGSTLNAQFSIVNTTFSADHVTSAAYNGNTGLVLGVGCETAVTMSAGVMASIQNWLTWRLTAGAQAIAQASASCTLTNGTYVAVDNNVEYNLTGSPYTPIAAKFATTPGTHDIARSGVPQFADRTRQLLNFDQWYLGLAVSSNVWSASTAYNYNDVVSASTSGFFEGRSFNWRCKALAGCPASANNKPGTGSAFTPMWEPAALQYIVNSVLAGQLVPRQNGGTGTMIDALLDGVFWAHSTNEPANWCSATDNGDSRGQAAGFNCARAKALLSAISVL